MKTIKTLLVSALILTAIVSCDDKVKPEDPIKGETVDLIDLYVSFNTASLEGLWGEDWKSGLQYDWDETDTIYGTLGYSEPEHIKGTIFNVDAKTGNRTNHFFKVFELEDSDNSLYSAVRYDMLFYNFGTDSILFHLSDDYQSLTAQADYLGRTDELQGAFMTGVEFAPHHGSELEVDFEPYTYIYLLQIIIKDNVDPDGANRITGADGITLTGLAKGTDLLTRTPFADTVSITTQDVKPLQNHVRVQMTDGTIADRAGIMAARILTWGLPSDATGRNYLGIGLTLRNGQTRTVSRDITDQLRQNPKGGVITICLSADDIL